MFAIIIGVVITALAVLLLIQTLRIGDLKATESSLRIGADNLVKQRESYYEKLQDMTVSRDGYAAMYEDACEAIEDGKDKLSRLQDDVQKGHTLALKLNREIIDLKQQNRKLSGRQKPKSVAYLQSGMCEIARFIAANQWMMEENKSLAEVVASVGEVAEAITERED